MTVVGCPAPYPPPVAVNAPNVVLCPAVPASLVPPGPPEPITTEVVPVKEYEEDAVPCPPPPPPPRLYPPPPPPPISMTSRFSVPKPVQSKVPEAVNVWTVFAPFVDVAQPVQRAEKAPKVNSCLGEKAKNAQSDMEAIRNPANHTLWVFFILFSCVGVLFGYKESRSTRSRHYSNRYPLTG